MPSVTPRTNMHSRGVTEGKASYVYLLMLGVGVMKPMFSRDRAEAPEP